VNIFSLVELLLGERLVVHVRSVLGGMHYEYSLASASA
jgi:hypothetical protein